ncbi:hypothetical protein [Psychrobacter aquaticus]|uniref:Uncharacterized protein n=1 Tax=Psychrobacter aquaticus CMS 56 TaxID=1354303 RepID=U4TA10_9GAMM|nr:hypothetical protein [Psychrobacter aquaticus]ERL56961.1 hypothetical protein M917_0158 [Psychrobacter aquaticus CMS 56]
MALNREIYNERRYIRNKVLSLTNREAVFLRNHLAHSISYDFEEVPNSNVKNGLVLEFDKRGDTRDLIDENVQLIKTVLLPEVNFDWLKSSLRARVFALNVLKNDDLFRNARIIYSDSIIDRIYSIIDHAQTIEDDRMSQDEMARILLEIKSIWEKISNEDNYTKWLKSDDGEQIKWVMNYLKDKRIYKRSDIDHSDNSQIRDAVLASLDLIDNPRIGLNQMRSRQSAEKELIIDKMKRAWSQQKFRDSGKTKKPFHLPLTISANANLKELAKFNSLTDAKQLEQLINSAHKKIFFDEDGKRIY